MYYDSLEELSDPAGESVSMVSIDSQMIHLKPIVPVLLSRAISVRSRFQFISPWVILVTP